MSPDWGRMKSQLWRQQGTRSIHHAPIAMPMSLPRIAATCRSSHLDPVVYGSEHRRSRRLGQDDEPVHAETWIGAVVFCNALNEMQGLDPVYGPGGFFDYSVPGGFQTRDNTSPFSVYGMTGNVWGWCWDWYSGTYFAQAAAGSASRRTSESPGGGANPRRRRTTRLGFALRGCSPERSESHRALPWIFVHGRRRGGSLRTPPGY